MDLHQTNHLVVLSCQIYLQKDLLEHQSHLLQELIQTDHQVYYLKQGLNYRKAHHLRQVLFQIIHLMLLVEHQTSYLLLVNYCQLVWLRTSHLKVEDCC